MGVNPCACASSINHHFNVQGDEIADAFDMIARQISLAVAITTVRTNVPVAGKQSSVGKVRLLGALGEVDGALDRDDASGRQFRPITGQARVTAAIGRDHIAQRPRHHMPRVIGDCVFYDQPPARHASHVNCQNECHFLPRTKLPLCYRETGQRRGLQFKRESICAATKEEKLRCGKVSARRQLAAVNQAIRSIRLTFWMVIAFTGHTASHCPQRTHWS